ncbi:unnamed protein product [Fusarium graminearum]|nr:unnamed protein product [Fusarium graminearum]
MDGSKRSAVVESKPCTCSSLVTAAASTPYAVTGSDCDDLLELLHGLPLALAQAGSYLRETGVDAATYMRIYNEQWAELMGPCDATNRPLLDYDQGSVRTTWTISFKEIERQSPSAAKLLRLWAFLDNKQLWHGLLAVTADGGRRRTPRPVARLAQRDGWQHGAILRRSQGAAPILLSFRR